MPTFKSNDSVDAVPGAVHDIRESGAKIMGFGDRVYRTEGPRATHLRRLSESMGQLGGDPTWFQMSLAMEQAVMAEKGLYPNVDFFAASVYRSLGIPTDLFTPVFAVSRMAGWAAHVMEQHGDNRLIRPDSDYVGERDRRVVPLAQRGS